MSERTFLGVIVVWMVALLVVGGFEEGNFWLVLSHLAFGTMSSWYGYKRGVSDGGSET